MIYDKTELFFVKTLDYGIKTWKAQKTRIFNALNVGDTFTLDRSLQYRILLHIANSTSSKKNIAKELLEKFFKDFKEDVAVNKVNEIIKKYAKKYNVDEFELSERYRIIKRDMIEKDMHPNYKISIYKFKHTILLTNIVIEIFKEEGTEIVGGFPVIVKKERTDVPIVEIKKKRGRPKKA